MVQREEHSIVVFLMRKVRKVLFFKLGLTCSIIGYSLYTFFMKQKKKNLNEF